MQASGTTIPVLLDGRRFETVIDENGVQRFKADPSNPLAQQLAAPAGIHPRGFRLDEMAVRQQEGLISLWDYREMLLATGYSVQGFMRLPAAEGLALFNPLDADDEDAPGDRTRVVKGVITETLVVEKEVTVLVHPDAAEDEVEAAVRQEAYNATIQDAQDVHGWEGVDTIDVQTRILGEEA